MPIDQSKTRQIVFNRISSETQNAKPTAQICHSAISESSKSQEESKADQATCKQSSTRQKEKLRRRRLSKIEMNLLEAEYQKQSDWNIAKTKELSTRLNLSRVKIYKWHYDRKRKEFSEMV